MESTTSENQPRPTRPNHRLCSFLDSKKLAMLGADAAEAEVDLVHLDGFENYWCRKTWTDTGPDGCWVNYQRCSPGRACYQSRGAETHG